MSVKRGDLIKYFEENGFYLLREGKKHSIYTNNDKTIPIKTIADDSCWPAKGNAAVVKEHEATLANNT
jgi:hypothetical protein